MKRFLHISVSALLLLLLAVPTVAAAPLTWQQTGSLPPNPNAWGGHAVAYGNGQFLLSDGNNGIYTSPEAATWTHYPINGPGLAPVKFLNGRFVGGVQYGIGWGAETSTDGFSWNEAIDLGGQNPMSDVAYGNGRYLVASSDRVFALAADLKELPTTNPDGVLDPVRAVAFGKGTFVGATSGLYYTTDGQTWTEALPPTGGINATTRFTGVAYGEGRFVAGGVTQVEPGSYKAILYTSTDGRQWQRTDVDAEGISGVLFGGGQFLAWGAKSVLTSTDGTHWTVEPNPNGAALFTYGAGRFVAVGSDRTVMTATVCGSRFPDVTATDPSCDAIEALASRQILGGYPDGTFQPGAPVTRAELAKMLVITLGLKPNPQGALPFTDTANNWAAQGGYLQAAIAAGVINGYPDGTFRPGQSVTRAEAVKMIAAAAGLQPASGATYADIHAGDWFAGWVAAARQADLIGAGGYQSLWPTEQFQGTAAASRGETAKLLDNLSNH